jgi:hypothetical protein
MTKEPSPARGCLCGCIAFVSTVFFAAAVVFLVVTLIVHGLEAL